MGDLMVLIDFCQLDDWVLCRIYNKKGSIEKQQQVITNRRPNFTETETETEEKKPVVMPSGMDTSTSGGALLPNPASTVTGTGTVNDYMYFDTSDSVPKLNTDSSCSEHVVSPEFTCEVQSEPKMQPWENTLGFPYNYLDSTMDISFNSQFQGNNQLSPLQDMFMYLPKPF